jgi:tRNA dimethylallyltransferase
MKKIIVIAGPTASGKTDVALELATHFGTQIISADSRQCYTELNIGVAKPTEAQLKLAPHYFINSHSIHQPLNAADFEHLALGYLDTIFAKNDIAILVGGTGLYIHALCNGMDAMPKVNAEIDADINNLYMQFGLDYLQQLVAKEDPTFYATAEINNPVRLIRALVFIRSHGVSIQQYKTNTKVVRNFGIEKYVIDIPRETLYDRINTRVDDMMQQGLLEEVQQLLPFKNLKNLHTVGYTELFDYFENKTNVQTAIENIKQNTRRYAKRQVTWFKKDAENKWLSALQMIENIKATH